MPKRYIKAAGEVGSDAEVSDGKASARTYSGSDASDGGGGPADLPASHSASPVLSPPLVVMHPDEITQDQDVVRGSLMKASRRIKNALRGEGDDPLKEREELLSGAETLATEAFNHWYWMDEPLWCLTEIAKGMGERFPLEYFPKERRFSGAIRLLHFLKLALSVYLFQIIEKTATTLKVGDGVQVERKIDCGDIPLRRQEDVGVWGQLATKILEEIPLHNEYYSEARFLVDCIEAALGCLPTRSSLVTSIRKISGVGGLLAFGMNLIKEWAPLWYACEWNIYMESLQIRFPCEQLTLEANPLQRLHEIQNIVAEHMSQDWRIAYSALETFSAFLEMPVLPLDIKRSALGVIDLTGSGDTLPGFLHIVQHAAEFSDPLDLVHVRSLKLLQRYCEHPERGVFDLLLQPFVADEVELSWKDKIRPRLWLLQLLHRFTEDGLLATVETKHRITLREVGVTYLCHCFAELEVSRREKNWERALVVHRAILRLQTNQEKSAFDPGDTYIVFDSTQLVGLCKDLSCAAEALSQGESTDLEKALRYYLLVALLYLVSPELAASADELLSNIKEFQAIRTCFIQEASHHATGEPLSERFREAFRMIFEISLKLVGELSVETFETLELCSFYRELPTDFQILCYEALLALEWPCEESVKTVCLRRLKQIPKADGWRLLNHIEKIKWRRSVRRLFIEVDEEVGITPGGAAAAERPPQIKIKTVNLEVPDSIEAKQYQLHPQVVKQLLHKDYGGGRLKFKSKQHPGRHLVLPIIFDGRQYWFKYCPEQPGMEFFVSQLDRLMTGGATPLSLLINLEDTNTHESIPFLITPHVGGPSLENVFRLRQLFPLQAGEDLPVACRRKGFFKTQLSQGESLETILKDLCILKPGDTLGVEILKQRLDELVCIDVHSFIQTLWRVLVINPEDDKGDDYFLVPTEQEDGDAPLYRLVRIDNDRAFYCSTSKRYFPGQTLTPRVKSIVYYMNQMQVNIFGDTVQQQVVEDFLSISPAKLAQTLLEKSEREHALYNSMFSDEEACHSFAKADDEKSLLTLRITDEVVKSILKRLEKTQRIMRLRQKQGAGFSMTSLEILKQIHQELGILCERTFDSCFDLDRPELAYDRFPRELYPHGSISTLTSLDAISQSGRLLESERSLTTTDVMGIRRQHKESPRNAIEKLKLMELPPDQLAEIQLQLVSGDDRSFKQLLNRDQCIILKAIKDKQKRDSDCYSPEQLRHVLNSIIGLEFITLSLGTYRSVLTDEMLLNLLSPLKQSINTLDLSSCMKITMIARSSFARFFGVEHLIFPRLKALVVKDCRNLAVLKIDAPYLEELDVRGCISVKQLITQIKAPRLKRVLCIGEEIFAETYDAEIRTFFKRSERPNFEIHFLRDMQAAVKVFAVMGKDDRLFVPDELRNDFLFRCEEACPDRLHRGFQGFRLISTKEVVDCLLAEPGLISKKVYLSRIRKEAILFEVVRRDWIAHRDEKRMLVLEKLKCFSNSSQCRRIVGLLVSGDLAEMTDVLSTLTELVLHGREHSSEELRCLAEALSRNKTVVSVDLGYRTINQDDMEMLITAVGKGCVKTLKANYQKTGTGAAGEVDLIQLAKSVGCTIVPSDEIARKVPQRVVDDEPIRTPSRRANDEPIRAPSRRADDEPIRRPYTYRRVDDELIRRPYKYRRSDIKIITYRPYRRSYLSYKGVKVEDIMEVITGDTVDASFMRMEVSYESGNYLLEIWNIPASARASARGDWAGMYAHGAGIALFFCDLTQMPYSREIVPEDFLIVFSRSAYEIEPIKIIVGMKLDLAKKDEGRELYHEIAPKLREVAVEINAHYVECSSKTGEGIGELHRILADSVELVVSPKKAAEGYDVRRIDLDDERIYKERPGNTCMSIM